jgi:hypothetical protein
MSNPYDWNTAGDHRQPTPLARADARLTGPLLTAIAFGYARKDFVALEQAAIKDHHVHYQDRALRYFGSVQRALDWLIAVGLIRLTKNGEYLLTAPSNPRPAWPAADDHGEAVPV